MATTATVASLAAQTTLRVPSRNCPQLQAGSRHLVFAPLALKSRSSQPESHQACFQCRASAEDRPVSSPVRQFLVPALAAAILGTSAFPVSGLAPALADSRYDALFEKVKEAESGEATGTATIEQPAEEAPKVLSAFEKRAQRKEQARLEQERLEAERKAEAVKRAAQKEAEIERAEEERRAEEARLRAEKQKALLLKENEAKKEEAKQAAANAVPAVAGKKKTHGFLPLFIAQFLLTGVTGGLVYATFFLPKDVEADLNKKLDTYKEKAKPLLKQAEVAAEKAKPGVEKALTKANELYQKAKPALRKAVEQAKPLASQALDASKQAAEKAKESLQEARK